MRHHLIDSAENWKYKPFAESCIVKLKKLGLPYADQSYEVDGVSIKVRIEPGHEYIRIEGELLPIAMDSGVVDLINVGANVEARFAPGVLYQSTQTAAYKANFTRPVNGGKTNPSDSAAGQFLGYLRASSAKVRGTVFDKAYSFYPRNKVLSAPGAEPVTWGADPQDAAVWAKKYAVNKCPASMFTGKCRMYAQAMYGRPLYKRNGLDADGNEAGATVGDPDIPIVQDGGGRPYITIYGYADEGKSPPGTVDIWTSSGVYLHPATGKHFLMNSSGGNVYIYPLISSKIGEKMRQFIKAASGLNAADRERCEAYILAYSKPKMEDVQVVEDVVPDAVNTWSLGYGWHWNWSGTKATLTSFVIEGFDEFGAIGTPGYTILNKSFRYELTVTIAVAEDKSFTASASMTTVEDGLYWYVLRGYACIAEPDWPSGGMIKSTDRFNREFYPCDAPFYSFYKRDELQVARVKITRARRAEITETHSTEIFRNGRFTTGAHGGFATSTRDYVAEWTIEFSCGGTYVAFETGSGQTTNNVYGEKTFGGHANEGNLWDPPWSTAMPVNVGYPDADGNYAQTLVSSFPPATYGVPILYSFTETLTQTGKSTIGAVEAVAPIYDAEALFLYGRQVTEIVVDNTLTSAYTGQGYAVENGGVRSYVTASHSTTGISTAAYVQSPVQRDDSTVENAYLVYSGGVTPARTDLLKLGLEDYGDDAFPLGANVFTSASTNVVVSGYINNPVGTDRTGELLGMVGWV